MDSFNDFKIKKQLLNALMDAGYNTPTPVQAESYSPILAGRDFVGIAQTGTGKTIAYLLPILQDLKYSKQMHPRVLILVPTRELVIQIVEQIELLTEYITIRVLGVYGGTNINPQRQAVAQGLDVIVGTPRRLYDLTISNSLKLKSVKKLVIDEVDIMLDFGFKTQLKNIFEHLPSKRQNLLFSATMTEYVDELIGHFLINPVKKTMSISGTPLDNISQSSYSVPNFYTKANLLNHLLQGKESYGKVLIFVASKADADLLFETLDIDSEISVIHAGKTQHHRTTSLEKFENGDSTILIATDVISRGVDLEKITTVISVNTPLYPENYIHRMGRTGRAEQRGNSILFFNEEEQELKETIESLMNYSIPLLDFPEDVEITNELTPQEIRARDGDEFAAAEESTPETAPGSFHEKSAKNSKVNADTKSYHRKIKEKYKKPQKRGDKIQNLRKKKKKR